MGEDDGEGGAGVSGHLPNASTSPPGEWRYMAPETGQHFRGSNWPELETQLRSHYNAAGYPLPPNLYELVEKQICAQVPSYCVDASGQPPVSPSLSLTFTTALQGTKTLINWMVHGKQLVPSELAAERAAVCTMCIFNQEPQGCTACNSRTVTEIVERLVGKRSTPYDGKLKACVICHCHLKGKVHLPHDILWKNMTDEQKERLPQRCWLAVENT